MKRNLTLAAVAAAILIAVIVTITVNAGTVILTGLSLYTGTNDTMSTSIGATVVYAKTLTIQNGGLLAGDTNSLMVLGQISLDNTNFITICTYIPSSTNQNTTTGGDTYLTPTTNITIYGRVRIVTKTNSVPASIPVGVGITQ